MNTLKCRTFAPTIQQPGYEAKVVHDRVQVE